jgi:hypothetical protein
LNVTPAGTLADEKESRDEFPPFLVKQLNQFIDTLPNDNQHSQQVNNYNEQQ